MLPHDPHGPGSQVWRGAERAKRPGQQAPPRARVPLKVPETLAMEYTFGAPLPGYGVVSSQPAPPRTQPAAVMQSVQYVGPCRPTGPAPSLGLGSPLPEARITATASMPRMWESIPVGAQPQEVDPRTSSGWHPSQTYVSTRDAPAEGSQVVSAQTTQSGPSVALNAAPAPRFL
ncbi:hypothetical protein AK812_SmicGene6656 [Symbiodinium microadriaticum]|uniref:Uncharacterized protein n=1 Tax=Symbiodinium microadriaticum TaxID=2951 RepID=A0A1Q9EQP1_SYMMI|nr:hypothetical protein AK812_SmicGene6656 [Symbiodinium microadriaticum]